MIMAVMTRLRINLTVVIMIKYNKLKLLTSTMIDIIIWTNTLGKQPIVAVCRELGYHLCGEYLWAKRTSAGIRVLTSTFFVQQKSTLAHHW